MNQSPPEDALLSLSEIAARLRLSRTTVWRLVRDKKLKGVRISGDSGHWQVYESDFQAYLASRMKAR